MKRVDMRELAGRLGVDRATVSRALSRDKAHLVAPATRERVREQAGLLGYRPDLMAATLRRGRSYTVGILVSDLMNEVMVRVVRGLVVSLDAGAAQDVPMTPLIAETGEDPETVRRLLRTFLSRRVDAIVSLTSTEADGPALMEAATEVPVVLAVRSIASVRLPTAVCDDAAGGALVAEHLFAQGHRRVCQLQGPATAATFRSRAAGFSRVAAAMGMAEGPTEVVAPAATSRMAKAALDTILAGAERPTAVFAHNDALALGLIEAMRPHGLAYPDDIGIVGFNDTELTRVLARPLTTVAYPVTEVSHHAARLVEALVADRSFAWQSASFAPTLIDRGSAYRAAGRRFTGA
jgi:LacI family transcriptional regulator